MRPALPLMILLLATTSCGKPAEQGSPPPRTEFEADEAPASPAAERSRTDAATGPGISPTAAPGVAFNYNYSYALAWQRVAEMQERHAAMCEELTVARCRITGMHYRVLGPEDIEARLELKLDPAVARAFGRRASEAVLQADGMVTETEISGVDAGGQIRQANTDISRLQASDRLAQASRACSVFATRTWASRICSRSRTSIARAASGRLSGPVSRTRSASSRMLRAPRRAMRPNSARWPRTALINCVRWRSSKARVRCSIIAACCSTDLIGTKRMLGRTTASQIPSASAASFLLVLTKGRTYWGGISRTSWPRLRSSRAQ